MITMLNVQKTVCIYVILSCTLEQYVSYEDSNTSTTECPDSTTEKYNKQTYFKSNKIVELPYRNAKFNEKDRTNITGSPIILAKGKPGKKTKLQLMPRTYIKPSKLLYSSKFTREVYKAQFEINTSKNSNLHESHLNHSQIFRVLDVIQVNSSQTQRNIAQSFKHINESDNYLKKILVKRARKKIVKRKIFQSKVRRIRSDEKTRFNILNEWVRHTESTAGRRINIFRLLNAYSLICPLSSCDANYGKLHNTNINVGGCPPCRCDAECLIYNKCCPDSIYGYLPNECTCVELYPDCRKSQYGHNMVSKCPFTFLNISIINLCSGPENHVSPVISNTTGILYKNAFCALCNEVKALTNLTIALKCPKTTTFPYKNILDLDKRLLQKNRCVVSYSLDRSMCNLRAKPKMNKCNISGLWKEYDPDIDWACNNLLLHFFDFKNVFCYICNPSISSVQAKTSVSSCNVTGLWRSYNASFEKACKHHGQIYRLKPFKNIYCAICNGAEYLMHHSHLINTFYSSGFTTVLDFRYNFFFRTFHLNNITNIMSVLEKIETIMYPLLPNSSDVCTKFGNSFFNIPDLKHLRQLIKDYSRVCGLASICNKTQVRNEKEENLYLKDRNPICEYCSCKTKCVYDQNCCFDTVLQHLPYSCFKFNFLNSKSQNIRINEIDENLLHSIYWYFGQKAVIVDKCINRNAPAWLRQKCEENNKTDLLNNVPISSNSNSIASKNIYCLMCDMNLPGIWGYIGVVSYCDEYVEPWLHINTTPIFDYVNQNCLKTFLPQTRACLSSDVKDADSVKYYYERRSLENTQQTVIRERHTPLNASDRIIYNYCNKTQLWFNDKSSVKTVCESKSTSILSLPHYNIGMKTYKNVACFICNPAIDERTIDNMSLVSSCKSNSTWNEPDKVQLCSEGGYSLLWFPYTNFHCQNCNLPPLYKIIKVFGGFSVTYRTIFSFNTKDWRELSKREEEKGIVSVCTNGTFDEEKNKCRNLYCRAGLVLINGKTCATHSETTFNVTYEIKMLMTLRKTTLDSCSMNNISTSMICYYFITQMNSSLDGSADYINEFCRIIDLDQCLHENNGTEKDNRYLIINMLSLVMTNTLSLFQKNLMQFLLGPFDLSDASTGAFCSFTLDFEIQHQVKQQCLPDVKKSNFFVNIDRCFICPHFLLDDVDFHADNMSNGIFINGLIVPKKYIGWSGNNACICLDDFVKVMSQMNKSSVRTETEMTLLFKIHDIYSNTCTITSLLCLSITFLTYCFFKSLRTIAGKNNMTLVFALFFAQASFGLLKLKTSPGLYCILTGVALHYFWLAAFFAMNVCSFHMLRMFSLSLFYKLYLTRYTHLKYILYAFCFPAFIVSMTVVSNMTISDRKYFGYGHGKCFLSDFYSVILAFIVPASIVSVSNMLFYIIALYNIKTVRNRMRNDRDREDLLISLKLCTIAGITWPLLIVDGAMEISWFSFIAVTMNALQGVFIFLSFICNTRVLNLYMGCICIMGIPEVRGVEIPTERSTHMTDQL